jgi:parallel beta-helix repeat protein
MNNYFCTSHENNGILLGTSDNIVITGNQIIENDVHGIYLSGCKGCIIRGNICYSNGKDGIKLRHYDESLHIPSQFNTIAGNLCCYNGRIDYGDGINICAYSNHNIIFGNSCIKNKTDGIRIGEQGTPNTINNNIISANVCVIPYQPWPWSYPIQIDNNNGEGHIIADNIGIVKHI